MKVFLRWLKRRRYRARRELRLSEIESLGYELVREEGATLKRYFLRSPDGQLLDNQGMGWASSAEAHAAARKYAVTDTANTSTPRAES
jgi:hypothetical protein